MGTSITCPGCQGKGNHTVSPPFTIDEDGGYLLFEPCETCNGSGKVPGCTGCNLPAMDFDNGWCDCEIAKHGVAV